MNACSRLLALLLCVLVLAQSTRSDAACSAASGERTMAGMPAGHHMHGGSTPGRAPEQHPCGPMSGALCQAMTSCLDLGAPTLARRIALPSVTHTAPPAVAPRAAVLRDLAPPLTPPRA